MNFIQRYQQMMRGRYGRFDFLNRFVLVCAFILWMLSPFFRLGFLRIIVIALILYVLYRFFSKRIYVRLNENKAIQQALKRIDQKIFHRKKTSQIHQLYFECPKCHQKLRAPKGKGKIKVTCSTCGHVFIKKV